MRGACLKLFLFLLVILSFVVGTAPLVSAADDTSPFKNFASEDRIETLNAQIEKLFADGQYERSLAVAKEAAQAAKDAFGDRHIQYAQALNNLAWHEQTLGDYSAARKDFEQSLNIYESVYGPNAPQMATVMNNLALLLCFQGDFDSALPLMQRVLSLQESLLGPDHAELSFTLNNLASVQSSLGKTDDSLKTLQRALAVERENDIDSKALTLNNLAMLSQQKGDTKAAASYLERIVSLKKESRQKHHPDMIEILNNLAMVKFSLGDQQQAHDLLTEALDIARSSLGENHIDYATTLTNLALIEISSGSADQAKDRFLHAADLLDRHITNVLPSLSFAEQRAFLSKKIPPYLSDLVSTCTSGDDVSRSYDHIFRWKGLLIETLRWQTAMRKNLDSRECPAELQELLTVRRDLSRLFHQSGSVDFPSWQRQFDDISAKKERLERLLLARLGQGKTQDALTGLTLPAFLHLLKDNEALIDLYVYDNLGDSGKDRKHYAGYVSDSSGRISRVELGRSADIDAVVQNWCRSMLAKSDDAEQYAQLFRKLTFEKLLAARPDLKGKRLFISPDGMLSKLPLNIFFAGADQVQEIAQLDSPRELAYLRNNNDQGDADPKGGIVVVGGVDFSSPKAQDAKSLFEILFPQLPGTLLEAKSVLAMAAENSVPGQLLTGRQATKANLLASLGQARYAHLATHGFFADEGFSMQEFRLRLAEQGSKTRLSPSAATSRNPLLESAIVLSAPGAPTALDSALPQEPVQRAAALRSVSVIARMAAGAAPGKQGADSHLSPSDTRDQSTSAINGAQPDATTASPLTNGPELLTAEEIVGVDLKRCKFIVLSACETGLGARDNTQGVLGLRAAIMAAGARTLIISLWKVPDEATVLLMDKFYHNLWGKGEPPAVALRHAQEVVREAYTYKTLKGYNKPINWAAWVLVGEGW